MLEEGGVYTFEYPMRRPKERFIVVKSKNKKTTVVLYFNGKGVIIANKDWEHSNHTFIKTREVFIGSIQQEII